MGMEFMQKGKKGKKKGDKDDDEGGKKRGEKPKDFDKKYFKDKVYFKCFKNDDSLISSKSSMKGSVDMKQLEKQFKSIKKSFTQLK